MSLLGFRRRTSFHVAVTSAQLSEFSLIFVALGARLNLIGDKIVNLIMAVALVTIVISTYLIIYSSKIYRYLSPALKIIERKKLTEITYEEGSDYSDHVILVGAGRLGLNILKGLRKKGLEVIVVDFDPDVVKTLQSQQIPIIYGDITDQEIFEKALGKNAKLIISTVFDPEDTNHVLTEVEKLTHKVPVVVTSPTPEAALDYYKKGAVYVIIPRILSSHLVQKHMLENQFEDLREGKLRKEHIEEITSNHIKVV